MRRIVLSFIILLHSIFFVSCSHSPTKIELEAKYASTPSQFIDVDNTRIHYRDEGSGPTIILIHGVLSSLHTWDVWSDDLKKDHRVIRLDIPAFGLTGKSGNDDYKLDNYISILDHFLTKIGAPEKFSIAGNSLGGLIAWNYSLVHQEKIERLILIDAAAYPQELPFTLKLMIAPGIRNIPPTWVPEFIVRKNIESAYGDPSRMRPGTIEHYSEVNKYPGNHEATIKLFQLIDSLSHTEPQRLADLKKLKMPILVLWGEKDKWVPFNPRWKQDLPGASFIFYPGVGHIPMEEIPEQSVKDLRDWIQKSS